MYPVEDILFSSNLHWDWKMWLKHSRIYIWLRTSATQFPVWRLTTWKLQMMETLERPWRFFFLRLTNTRNFPRNRSYNFVLKTFHYTVIPTCVEESRISPLIYVDGLWVMTCHYINTQMLREQETVLYDINFTLKLASFSKRFTYAYTEHSHLAWN